MSNLGILWVGKPKSQATPSCKWLFKSVEVTQLCSHSTLAAKDGSEQDTHDEISGLWAQWVK